MCVFVDFEVSLLVRSMGGICSRYCCRKDKRQYLRTRYNVEREMSVEFENLMDDDTHLLDTPQYGTVMTDHERKLLSERKFHDLVQYQRKVDVEIEEQLREQEEQLRMEEEAFYEAKRQAAQVARKLKNQEQATNKKYEAKSWLGNDAEEWEIAVGEEDFEQFLENVRKRSFNSQKTTRSVPCQVHVSSINETRSREEVHIVPVPFVEVPKDSKLNSKTDVHLEKSEKEDKINDIKTSDSENRSYGDFVSSSILPNLSENENSTKSIDS